MQARAQFAGIKRFGNVVVSPGLEPPDNVFKSPPSRNKDDIGPRIRHRGAHPAADVQAVDLRHHPIQHGDLGPLRPLQDTQGLPPIHSDQNLKSPTLQGRLDQVSRRSLIIGNQNSHVAPPAPGYQPQPRGLGGPGSGSSVLNLALNDSGRCSALESSSSEYGLPMKPMAPAIRASRATSPVL